MSNYETQMETDHASIEGVVHLLFLALRDARGPWTITRVNDFSKEGSDGSWEDHEWTNKGQVRHSPNRIWMSKTPIGPPKKGNTVLADDDKDEEDNNMSTGLSVHDWSIGEVDYTSSDQEDTQKDLAKAIHVWSPMEDEDRSMELKTLFKEGRKGDATNA